MKIHVLLLPALTLLGAGCSPESKVDDKNLNIEFQEVNQVKVQDAFWKPRFNQWREVTANDVLNKFEGKHIHDAKECEANDTFRNFDLVAEGKRDIDHHAGAPWFDGLVYETIRGISDFMSCYPDTRMERIYPNAKMVN